MKTKSFSLSNSLLRSYIVPLGVGLMLLLLAVMSESFKRSQDIRSRAADGIDCGVYSCITPTEIPTIAPTIVPTPLPANKVTRIVGTSSGITCNSICAAVSTEATYKCISAGNDAAGTNGKLWTWTSSKKCYTASSTTCSTVLKTISSAPLCSGSKPKWTYCQCYLPVVVK
jgi:hypothetical protein